MTAAGRRGEGSGAAGRARSGRSGRSWPSGVDGDDLSAATADQHYPVQLLGEDLQEFHVLRAGQGDNLNLLSARIPCPKVSIPG